MRLICPNCGAQYKIDARIIPETGRDVQCSACSHTWFQRPEETAPVAQQVPERVTAEVPTSAPEPSPAPAAPSPAPAPDPVPATAAPELAATGAGYAAAGAPQKREVDPEVMSVLREEAAREKAARAADRASLEVQSDLDLPAPSEGGAQEARAKLAHAPRRATRANEQVRALAEASPTDPALRPAPKPDTTNRGNLLPDIEEINSTLEPADHATQAGTLERPEPPSARIARVRRGQGRRLGFGLSILIFATAAVLYVKGPEIGRMVPAFAPSLEAYGTKVQEGRIWLDGLFRRASAIGAES